MRIKINFKTNNSRLPINNQHILNGYIHKVLGYGNEYHDTVSKYNISNLIGGSLNKETGELIYKDSAHLLVSSLDMDFIDKFISGVRENRNITTGFDYSNIETVNELIYDRFNNFFTRSPVIIREDKINYSVKDEDFEDKFEKYLIRVASKHFGKDIKLKVKLGYHRKTKLIDVKGIRNLCSIFSFYLEAPKEISEFFYYTGIGVSRGSGFGTIEVQKNKHK